MSPDMQLCVALGVLIAILSVMIVIALAFKVCTTLQTIEQRLCNVEYSVAPPRTDPSAGLTTKELCRQFRIKLELALRNRR